MRSRSASERAPAWSRSGRAPPATPLTRVPVHRAPGRCVRTTPSTGCRLYPTRPGRPAGNRRASRGGPGSPLPLRRARSRSRRGTRCAPPGSRRRPGSGPRRRCPVAGRPPSVQGRRRWGGGSRTAPVRARPRRSRPAPRRLEAAAPESCGTPREPLAPPGRRPWRARTTSPRSVGRASSCRPAEPPGEP